MHQGDLCICGHTRASHFEEGRHACSLGDCLCEGFVLTDYAVPVLEALRELVSAVQDGLRRHAAGDPNAIASNIISATLRQAEYVIKEAQRQ